MPSKTTVIQLNRRVYSNTVACTAQISTDALNQCSSTLASKNTNPPEVTTWAEYPQHDQTENCHDEAWITQLFHLGELQKNKD